VELHDIDALAQTFLEAAYDAVKNDTEMDLSFAAVAEMADMDNGPAKAAFEYLLHRNLVRAGEDEGIFELTGYGVAAVELQRSEPEVQRALNDLAVAVHACQALDEKTKADLYCDIETMQNQLRKSEPDKELLQRVWDSIERVAGHATDEIENALTAIQNYGWFLK
jgi:hypothetical protein